MYHLLLIIGLYSQSIDTLKVSDFKGTPDSTLLAKGIVAHTETTWVLSDSIGENGRHWWNVEFFFIPEDSWTITDCPSIMAHETTHYRISMLMCNKFRKVLPKYQNCDSARRQKLKKEFGRHWHNMRNLQALFDRETQNSGNRTLEKIWERNIYRDIIKQ